MQELYWWEVGYLFQRLLFVGFAQWVGHLSRRLLFGRTVTLVYLLALLATRPHKRIDVGVMAYSSQGILLLMIYLSNLLHYFAALTDEDDERNSFELQEAVLGFGSVDGLVVGIIISSITYITTFFVLMIYQASSAMLFSSRAPAFPHDVTIIPTLTSVTPCARLPPAGAMRMCFDCGIPASSRS